MGASIVGTRRGYSHRICLVFVALMVTGLLVWWFRVSQAASRTWTGASISNPTPSLRNNFWTTAENWSGNTAPVAGDDLIFGSAPQASSLNTFANGTTFNSISISAGHTMQGNSIALNAGITGSSGTILLSAIKLNNLQVFGSTVAGTGPVITSPIDNNGNGLIFNGPGNFTSVGVISGTGSLHKLGSGTALLAGANTYTGATTIQEGTLLVFGSQPSSAVSVSGGATVGGMGTVGAVNVSFSVPSGMGGAVSPGNVNHATGILTVNGDLSLQAGTNLNTDLNGIDAGSGYDQLNVNGAVHLGTAPSLTNLNLSLGFTPTPGATFIIIKNDGTDSVSGEFAGKPEGSSFAVNGTTFFISYKGGDGNDVALRVLFTWDGGGTTSNWTEAANWVGDVAPTAGAFLIFPDNAARKTNVNNFPADTNFGFVTITGNGYDIVGNSITLTNGITINSPPSAALTAFEPNITLTQPQTFTNIGQNLLVLLGQLNLNGFGVTVDGTQNINFGGRVTGAGGISKNGLGTLFMAGLGNNYTGTTQINNGTLSLVSQDGNGLGATGAGNDTVINSSGSMLLNFGVSTPEAIGLNGAIIADRCVPCSINGVVTLTADSAILVNVDSILVVKSVTQSGGSRTLTKTGPGTLILTETSTHSATNITTGTLLVNGSFTGTTTISGGTLGGTGTVVGVNANSGSVSPGASPGTLTTGNVTLSGSSSFIVELGGTAPGDGHDRLIANGNVTLNGANLSASLINGFNPTPGNQFTIIQSTGSISGTFAQGNSITIGGRPFSITYNSNSVVLRATVPPTRTWSGGGTTDNWSEGANWVGGVAPGVGDDLVFPPGAARKTTNTNDFANGTTFNSILFTDGGYSLLGNGIRLTHGIVDSVGNSNQRLFFSSITLDANQTFSELGPAALVINSPLDTNGRTLTLNGSGNNSLRGIISGSGSLIINEGNADVLFNVHTLSGSTVINSGSLAFSQLPNSAITLNGGTLVASSNCHANSLTATGGLFLLVDTSPTINGNLTLNPNVTYQPDFFPLSGIDRLNVGGAVTLGNSVLDVKALFSSQPSGDNFIVINKTSAGAVQGNFKNLPEGATLMIKGVPFRISYIGGDGNDVVLTKAPPILFTEEGASNRAVVLDSVTFVRDPLPLSTDHNFSADHRTRVVLLTSNLGLNQPDPSVLTVQAAGFNLTVEGVGTFPAVNGLDGSYIVVRLPEGLPTGDLPMAITLRGMTSNTAILRISP